MNKLKVNDKVIVLSGNYKGIKGVIKKIIRKKNKVIVSGINVCIKHIKPNKQNTKGKIVEIESPIHISNLKKISESLSKKIEYKIGSLSKDKIEDKIESLSKDKRKDKIGSLSKDKRKDKIGSLSKDKIEDKIESLSKDKIEDKIESLSKDKRKDKI